MSTATIGLIQYAFVAVATLLLVPLADGFPATQTLPIALFGLNGGQSIRLVLESTGLLLLCLLAFRANRRMPEDGKGWSFIRRLIIPLTALFAVIVADNALAVTGVPGPGGLDRYTLSYTGGLLVCGIWISTVWVLHFDSLDAFFRLRHGGIPAQGRRKIAIPYRTALQTTRRLPH